MEDQINKNPSENTGNELSANAASEGTKSEAKPTMTPAQRLKYIKDLKAKKEADKKAELKRQKIEQKKVQSENKSSGNQDDNEAKAKKIRILIIILILLFFGAGLYMYKSNPSVFKSGNKDDVAEENSEDYVVNTDADSLKLLEDEINSSFSDNTKTSKNKSGAITGWVVGYGAYKDIATAEKIAAKIKNRNYTAGTYWIPDYFPNGKALYKVYIGPFVSKSEAKAILPDVHKYSPEAYMIEFK
ncbi:MAG: SPOR domain-containing protein [Bacteroidales bacterium]|nr:SPOR domain-containing protein [Bacteroidales bacterium]